MSLTYETSFINLHGYSIRNDHTRRYDTYFSVDWLSAYIGFLKFLLSAKHSVKLWASLLIQISLFNFVVKSKTFSKQPKTYDIEKTNDKIFISSELKEVPWIWNPDYPKSPCAERLVKIGSFLREIEKPISRHFSVEVFKILLLVFKKKEEGF